MKNMSHFFVCKHRKSEKPRDLIRFMVYTGELGYDRFNGTRKIGPSYAKSVVCI